MGGQSGHIIHNMLDCHQVSWEWMDIQMTTQLKVSFDLQATWVINVLGLFSDMLSMSVCTCRTMRWQTSGRLMQELHACILHVWHQRAYMNRSARKHLVLLMFSAKAVLYE